MTALCGSGVQAEPHVRPGGVHSFGILARHTAIAYGMTAAHAAWVGRAFGV
ncbi:hypothetical protein AB0L85_32385 [Streptomyces sp. NPDC052051]|uniref:hypothetical protein n=1 Tax=Streptomyces sp. NPDC052051 TaxID=3154649 RepID=UPI003446C962